MRIAAALFFSGPWHWGSQAWPYYSSVTNQHLPRTTTRCVGNQETSSQSPQTDPDQGWKRKATGRAGKRNALLEEEIYQYTSAIAKIRDFQLHVTPLGDCMQTDWGNQAFGYIFTGFLAYIWDLQSPNKTNIPQTLRKYSCSHRKSRHKVKTNATTERSRPCQADRCFEGLCQFMSYQGSFRPAQVSGRSHISQSDSPPTHCRSNATHVKAEYLKHSQSF